VHINGNAKSSETAQADSSSQNFASIHPAFKPTPVFPVIHNMHQSLQTHDLFVGYGSPSSTLQLHNECDFHSKNKIKVI